MYSCIIIIIFFFFNVYPFFFFFFTYCPHGGVALTLGLVGLTPWPGMAAALDLGSSVNYSTVVTLSTPPFKISVTFPYAIYSFILSIEMQSSPWF